MLSVIMMSFAFFTLMLSVIVLSVAFFFTIKLNVFILSALMLSVIMLSVVMLSVIILSVVVLSVVILSVVMLNAVAVCISKESTKCFVVQSSENHLIVSLHDLFRPMLSVRPGNAN